MLGFGFGPWPCFWPHQGSDCSSLRMRAAVIAWRNFLMKLTTPPLCLTDCSTTIGVQCMLSPCPGGRLGVREGRVCACASVCCWCGGKKNIPEVYGAACGAPGSAKASRAAPSPQPIWPPLGHRANEPFGRCTNETKITYSGTRRRRRCMFLIHTTHRRKPACTLAPSSLTPDTHTHTGGQSYVFALATYAPGSGGPHKPNFASV